ncbi:MAG: flavodoxin [Ruminococcus sp.]|jgi:flavodoxin short chain|nr:flavodoxin [Ruminococcus sp.]
MSKIAVVFWSGTGNTESIANAVADGAKEKGAEVEIIAAADFSADAVANYDGIAFGCPAMGAEVLEEDEFQPMWDAVKGSLGGKKVVLFGSYGWGDGEWLRNWEEDAKSAGVALSAESLMVNEAPDDDAIAKAKDLGAAIA